MPRDTTWSEDSAALYRAFLPNHKNLTFAANSVSAFYDSVITLSSAAVNGLDLVRVYLRGDSAYNFTATGTIPTSLFVVDDEGYRYLLENGRVARSGFYYVAVTTTSPGSTASYLLNASQDLGADGKNTAAPLGLVINAAANQILRGGSFTGLTDLLTKVDTGAVSLNSAIATIVRAADANTSVATLTYQFFTGKIPTEAGLDYLVSPTGPNANNINSPYYQAFNLENRYINFAVNLGRDGDGRAAFQAAYGTLTLAEATKKAYLAIFGSTPDDAKVGALLGGGRDGYFVTYGKDGIEGIGTKAAMVGWLLAEAEKADLGIFARSNAAFLTDLADGATFGVDLIGVYNKPDYSYLGG